jgi:hypothetical protein
MNSGLPHLHLPVLPILIGCVIFWIIHRRLRRNVGRQKLRPLRSIVSIIILSGTSLAMLAASQLMPKLLSGIGAGLLCGALLGLVGLRLTKFEATAEGSFYTPDTRIGMALTLLFVGRLIYRFWALRYLVGAAHTPPPLKSALTYLSFGLLAGYGIVYYTGLLVRGRGKK